MHVVLVLQMDEEELMGEEEAGMMLGGDKKRRRHDHHHHHHHHKPHPLFVPLGDPAGVDINGECKLRILMLRADKVRKGKYGRGQPRRFSMTG